MRVYFLAISFFISVHAFAQKSFDTTFGKPVLWYTVYDPWAMFIGSDGPLLTVYETGKVIYWKDKAYHLADITKEGVTEIINKLNLNDTFFSKSKHVDASFGTDMPSYVLKTNFDTVKYFSVYGSFYQKEKNSNIPKQLADVYDFVSSFDSESSVYWLPGKIELMLSDYSHSTETPLMWPAGWPRLDDPQTVIRQGGMTTIFIHKKYFKQLKRLLAKRKQKQAIEISGRKFYIGYRFPLPNLY